MNSWEDAPWRDGRAGGYSRRPLEGDPMKGSSSKSVRGAPNHATHRAGVFHINHIESQTLVVSNLFLSANLGPGFIFVKL
jgi:hypothetical protein